MQNLMQTANRQMNKKIALFSQSFGQKVKQFNQIIFEIQF